MSTEKKVLTVISVMKGGGAERVAAQLTNEFTRCGVETEFLLTSASRENSVNTDLREDVPLLFLWEMIRKKEGPGTVLLKAYSLAVCKVFEKMKLPVPAHFAYLSFIARYGREIKALREKLQADPSVSAAAFLQPAIPITMLAARGLPNRVIFSERGDAARLMEHRYGRSFIKKYYARADAAVFQTEDAMRAYPENIAAKGTVISNPLKKGLPEPYTGERNKNITTFCRISKQKNLPLLVQAFAMLHGEYPEHKLRIIGDSLNSEGEEVLKELHTRIRELGIEDAVLFEPFSKNVHNEIIKDAMYINSSDYEGISNAMLEAMAIGLPVICTDCPVGGARATITDGVNGLLTPVGDAEKLCAAMKRLIGEPGLAEKLSRNAVRIREELTLEKTAKKWMELL